MESCRVAIAGKSTVRGLRTRGITPVCSWQAPEMFSLDLTRRFVVRLQLKPHPLDEGLGGWNLGSERLRRRFCDRSHAAPIDCERRVFCCG
jgi:hypothetical protein